MRERYFNLHISNDEGLPRENVILNIDLDCPEELKVTTLNGDYKIRFIYNSRYGAVYGIHKRTDDSPPNSSIVRIILNNDCSLHLLDSPKDMGLEEISLHDVLSHKKSDQFWEDLKNL